MNQSQPSPKHQFTQNKQHLFFARMYKTLYSKIFDVCIKFHQDQGLIADAIHDVFMEMLIKQHNLDQISNLEAYMITAVRRRVFKIKKNRFIESDELNKLADPDALRETKIIELETNQSRLNKMNEAIGNLHPKEKEVFLLKFKQGMSYEEIAQITEKSKQTIYNQVFNTIKKLKSSLKS